LNAEQWAEFNRLLDAPPQENPGLRKLLAGKAPWDVCLCRFTNSLTMQNNMA
jgi:hypothetical protein